MTAALKRLSCPRCGTAVGVTPRAFATCACGLEPPPGDTFYLKGRKAPVPMTITTAPPRRNP